MPPWPQSARASVHPVWQQLAPARYRRQDPLDLPVERRFLRHIQSQYRRAAWQPALDVRFQPTLDEAAVRPSVL